MESGASSPNINVNVSVDEDLIGSGTSVGEIISALARRGCSNLTSSIDLGACSDLPCAGGGFCDVYRGALHGGTSIAIKVLRVYDRPGGHNDKGKILKRAARELYHWSKLGHPNVLPLMGLAIFRGHISMVSGWMENGDLPSYLRLRPESNRMRLCVDVCAGLSYLHINEMVHGDLKAANVMVSSDGTAMIADFGNAQLKDLTLNFTNTAKGGFSVRWTAPELLLEDDGPQVSKEADVYAYGMTALEVLTGKVPFEDLGDNRIYILVAVKKKVPPRPDTGVCDNLWNILNECWAWEPSRRPEITTVNDRLQVLLPSSAGTWLAGDAASMEHGVRGAGLQPEGGASARSNLPKDRSLAPLAPSVPPKKRKRSTDSTADSPTSSRVPKLPTTIKVPQAKFVGPNSWETSGVWGVESNPLAQRALGVNSEQVLTGEGPFNAYLKVLEGARRLAEDGNTKDGESPLRPHTLPNFGDQSGERSDEAKYDHIPPLTRTLGLPFGNSNALAMPRIAAEPKTGPDQVTVNSAGFVVFGTPSNTTQPSPATPAYPVSLPGPEPSSSSQNPFNQNHLFTPYRDTSSIYGLGLQFGDFNTLPGPGIAAELGMDIGMDTSMDNDLGRFGLGNDFDDLFGGQLGALDGTSSYATPQRTATTPAPKPVIIDGLPSVGESARAECSIKAPQASDWRRCPKTRQEFVDLVKNDSSKQSSSWPHLNSDVKARIDQEWQQFTQMPEFQEPDVDNLCHELFDKAQNTELKARMKQSMMRIAKDLANGPPPV